MGWAKYFEDNNEIMCERHVAMQSRIYRSEVVLSYNNLYPITKKVAQNQGIPKKLVPENNKYKDKYIVCKDCGKKFIFTAKSQKYFAEKGWKEPKRCKSCRDYKNALYLMCSSF